MKEKHISLIYILIALFGMLLAIISESEFWTIICGIAVISMIAVEIVHGWGISRILDTRPDPRLLRMKFE